jgi:hypothetical protein
MHRRWYKTSAEEGCIYLIPRGVRVKFKIIGNDPYRHLFVVMPKPADVLLADSVAFGDLDHRSASATHQIVVPAVC